MTTERVDNVDPSKNASWKLPTKRCAQADPIECDVLIIGSGFLGCTFVRKILENGSTREKSIIIIDVGSQLSKNPGENIKNSIFFQRHISRSAPDIHSFRHILSVPEDNLPASLDPNFYHFNDSDYPGYVQGGRNPDQVPEYNLENSSVTYAIGGMATHWTACTPRQNKEIERSTIFSDQEWNDIYVEAESLLHTRNDVFNASIRQQAIFQVLKQDPIYADLISPLPVAATKLNDDPFLVRWTGADTVLGDHLIQRINNNDDNKLRILSQHLCMCLNTESNLETGKKNVISATIKDCIQNKMFDVKAKFFVVAAGAVLTPQLLFASKIKPPALGKYLSEHPCIFCQIVYSKEMVDMIAAFNPDREENATYPVPVPVNDPNPMLIIPVTKDHPCQGIIFKDSFTNGGIIANVDSRLTLDLAWFSSSQPNPNNMVTFSESITDLFGMPQPTFYFKLSDEDTNIAEMMMAELRDVATKLGGYLPGVEPSLLKPGTALHITGTTRMGDITKDPDEYVVDKNSIVIGFDNLYIGSCGVIPTGTACNPTLTAVAIACYACKDLISKLEIC